MENKTIGGKSKQEITEEYSFLVISCARKYTNQGVLFIDLIHAGNTGLIKAVDTFWCVKQKFQKLAEERIEECIKFTIDYHKKQTILSNTYNSLGNLSSNVHNFVNDATHQKEAERRFKCLCEGRKQTLLVVDHENKRITTATSYNKMVSENDEDHKVFVLPKYISVPGKKEHNNNLIFLKKKHED